MPVHHGSADELRRAHGLAEELPRHQRRHHRLDQQAHRRQRGREVGERVGDEPLPYNLGHEREAHHHPPAVRRCGPEGLGRQEGHRQQRQGRDGGAPRHQSRGGNARVARHFHGQHVAGVEHRRAGGERVAQQPRAANREVGTSQDKHPCDRHHHAREDVGKAHEDGGKGNAAATDEQRKESKLVHRGGHHSEPCPTKSGVGRLTNRPGDDLLSYGLPQSHRRGIASPLMPRVLQAHRGSWAPARSESAGSRSPPNRR